MAIGAELHSDEESLLLEQGSKQQDLWGINLYPGKSDEEWMEFDSIIRQRIINIVKQLKTHFDNAVKRALELFELTISDPRWRKRLKELTRVREVFCAAVLGSNEYHTSLEDLDRYFYYFAYAARANR